MKRLLVAACVLGLIAACAIQEAPPGGPEDKTPPTVVGTVPADSQTGVSPQTDVTIVFSEAMKSARLGRSIAFYPAITQRSERWRKDNVTIRLAEPLHEDTTYVVEIKPGLADAHNVRSDKSFYFAFSTSSALDSGVVSGNVTFRRKPSGKAVVRLFVLPKDSAFAPEAGKPDREVAANRQGEFQMEYLPTDSAPLLLWAFQDENTNRVFDAEREVGAVFGDTIALTPSFRESPDANIVIIDFKEPARLNGRVINQTQYDSTLITVTLSELTDTLPPTHITRTDYEGNYSFSNVLFGDYVMTAFVDFAADSVCGEYPCPDDSTRMCREPCAVYADTIRVQPGDELELKDLLLKGD